MKFDLTKIFLFFIIFIYSCSSSVRFTSNDPPPIKSTDKSSSQTNQTGTENNFNEFYNVTILETQTGTASFYADEFDGQPTSNGEIFDMYGISAAHPTYPAGTIVRVTNLSNGKSQIVRINDRMPHYPDRIIDLSYGAAKKLGMVEDGLAEVKIEVLRWGD